MSPHGRIRRRIPVGHGRRRISRIMRVHGRLIRIHGISRHVRRRHSIGRSPFVTSRRRVRRGVSLPRWRIDWLIVAFRGTTPRMWVSRSVRVRRGWLLLLAAGLLCGRRGPMLLLLASRLLVLDILAALVVRLASSLSRPIAAHLDLGSGFGSGYQYQ
jgi:hypothetical protein